MRNQQVPFQDGISGTRPSRGPLARFSFGPGRGFGIEESLTVGQRIFHAQGCDAVGLAAISDELGIKPPSFYGAFGSKADFFARILERYSNSVLALTDILVPGRPPLEALSDLSSVQRAPMPVTRNNEVVSSLKLPAAVTLQKA
jgi:TetR/AcrR family transcriptional regulator, repressor for divergent bdcA